jgi:excisionase family DNA binding protein
LETGRVMTKKKELPGLPMLDDLTTQQIRQHPSSSLRHGEPTGPPLPKPQKAKPNKKLGRGSEREPLTISVAEFEEMSGLSHTTVYKLMNKGTLKSKKVGGKRLIDYQSAKELIKAQN